MPSPEELAPALADYRSRLRRLFATEGREMILESARKIPSCRC